MLFKRYRVPNERDEIGDDRAKMANVSNVNNGVRRKARKVSKNLS